MHHIAAIAPWTRAIRSSSDVAGIPYTTLFILPHSMLGHQNESEQIVTPVRFKLRALQHPNRAFPERGSYLNNDQFAVLHNLLSVSVFFGISCIHTYISSMFCPKAGPSLQAEKPRLQFCRRQVFHRKLRGQGCSFTRDLIGAVASHCFPHPTLSLASEQTLKDLKRSQGHQRGDEESGFG